VEKAWKAGGGRGNGRDGHFGLSTEMTRRKKRMKMEYDERNFDLRGEEEKTKGRF
jgi:hypothetical protein